MVTLFHNEESVKAPQLKARLKAVSSDLHEQIPLIKK
jgi:hypothetical protein